MPLLRVTRTALTLATAALLTVETAEGEDLPSQDKARAAEAFIEGQALFAEGDYLEAARAFERAYLLAPHPAALANIGFCYDEAGDLPRAVSAFRKYVAQPNPKTPRDTAKILQYLDDMKSKVGDLVVHCSLPSCDVIVDSVPRGATPSNLVLLAGEHSVDVVAVRGELRQHQQYNMVVLAGQEVVLDAVLADEPTSPAAPKALEEPETRKQPEEPILPTVVAPLTEEKPIRLGAPFWVATSTTVVGLGLVAVLGGMNYTNMQDFRAGGSSDPQLLERGDHLTLGTNLAIGLSAVAATTALILAMIDVKKSRDKRRGGPGVARAARSWNITVGADQGALTFCPLASIKNGRI